MALVPGTLDVMVMKALQDAGDAFLVALLQTRRDVGTLEDCGANQLQAPSHFLRDTPA
jgi:hypothetical protein